MEKDIKEIRQKINQIDKDIASLFEKRMNCVKEVASYKKERALPIYDEGRENEVIDRNSSYIQNEEIKNYYVDFLRSTMDISKSYQNYLCNGMKVAYCGVEGAFAHIASKKLFSNGELVPYKSFKEAYKAVEKGICDTCVLPIENSSAGDVGEVMDLVFQGSLYINRIYELEINQNLLVKKGTKLEDVKTVISHPQALEQTKEFIQAHGFDVIECANTALSALHVKERNDNSVAAIASEETASLYGLEIIEKNINTDKNNTTRFAIFSKVRNLPSPEVKMGTNFILVFTVKNEAGALAKTLNIIGMHNFNMRNLKSRPLSTLMWNYYFFVELEGNINTNEGKQMLVELGTLCDRLKLVGTYISK
ncbi:MAG: chorismate mutase [Bacilli bacterium]